MAPRLSFRLILLGAFAVVIAAATQASFDLDRFLVPKEIALHLTAFLAGLLALGSLRHVRLGRVDLALLAFLGLSVVSALLATNHYVAVRALAITVSALLLFWLARAHESRRETLLNVLAAAVVLAAITSLLQAYGLELELFARQRAPGGTLGNRNFVAHAAAFGFPLVLLAAVRARKFFLPSAGAALVAAALVLTRSRAAWLAFAAMLVCFLFAVLLSSVLRREGRIWRRLAVVTLFCLVGALAAMLLPNTLRWRSDNPYLDSVKDVANYQEGSGRGRLVQYERSVWLALRHPVFGVGPGNWPVRYPEHVPDSDPSLDSSTPGLTFNPWPSSDWIAFLSERGPLAGILILLVFVAFGWTGLRRSLSAGDADDALHGATLAALTMAVGVVATFDAVLLLPLPAFLIWTALGALWATPAATAPPAEPAAEPEPGAANRIASPSGRAPRSLLLLLLLLVSLAGAMRSAAQLTAMTFFERGESLQLASQLDPGNYRLHMRLARGGKRAQRCEHAVAAHELFPASVAARSASRGCSD
jgi:O-antigen ligase